MIRTMHTTDPDLPSVTVIVVDYQDYLIIWNAVTLAEEGCATRDDLLNEAMCQAQQATPPPPSGEVIYMSDFTGVTGDQHAYAGSPSPQARASTGR